MDSSSNKNMSSNQSSFNLNFKTFYLFVILMCACCLVSIGYNFQINNFLDSGISLSICFILMSFLIYTLYEVFKSDTCEELNKTGWERLKSSVNRGSTYLDQQYNNGSKAMGDVMNNYGQKNSYINPFANSNVFPQSYNNSYRS